MGNLNKLFFWTITVTLLVGCILYVKFDVSIFWGDKTLSYEPSYISYEGKKPNIDISVKKDGFLPKVKVDYKKPPEYKGHSLSTQRDQETMISSSTRIETPRIINIQTREVEMREMGTWERGTRRQYILSEQDKEKLGVYHDDWGEAEKVITVPTELDDWRSASDY